MVNAQDIFQKGTRVLSAGIGVGSGIPVEIAYEQSILDGLIKNENGAIGVGGYAGWYHRSEYSWSYNHYVIGARGTFHYQFVDKLDTYGGLMAGYNIATSSWDGEGISDVSATGSVFDFSLFVGARYWFAPNFGVYSEVGYGIAYLSAGIALKF